MSATFPGYEIERHCLKCDRYQWELRQEKDTRNYAWCKHCFCETDHFIRNTSVQLCQVQDVENRRFGYEVAN